MTAKGKLITGLCTFVGTALLALVGAIGYGYFVIPLGAALDSGFITELCWALYIFVALLIWVTLWRIVYLAVLHRPGRRK